MNECYICNGYCCCEIHIYYYLQTIKTVYFHLKYYVKNIWLKRNASNHVPKYILSCDNIFLFFVKKAG